MSGSHLERRVIELESRLAFQEQALAQMSDALAQARNESAQCIALVRRLAEELRSMRGGMLEDPALEPPPPHY